MATPKKKTTKSKSKAKSKKPVAKKVEKVTETTEIVTIPDVIIQETPKEPITETPKTNKTEKMVELLSRESGATLEELAEATGWLINSVILHSLKGFLAYDCLMLPII